MAVEVVMPRMGWTMETGRLVEWLKHDGDRVQVGENLFTIESDKAVLEVEAIDSGILRIPPDAPTPDIDVKVGATMAYLLQPGEAVPWQAAATKLDTPATTPPSPAVSSDGHGAVANEPTPATVLGEPDKRAVSPRARRIAHELKIDWQTLSGSGKHGRIVERDVRAASQPPAPTVRATPLARRIAAETGIDLAELAAARSATQGSKHISRADVDAAAASKMAPPPIDQTPLAPLTPIRRLTAERMATSAHTTAPVTLTTEADVTELVELRAKIKADSDSAAQSVPSYTDLLTRLVALALRDHPALNATLRDDAIVLHSAVHIGVAVDTERGLMVPVVRDAHSKSVGQIAIESARLVEQARLGRAAPDDLRGSTFTITNLGMYEIDAFTPIINLPECAILGVGRIVPRLQLINEVTEKVGVRKMMALSLTFDHRVVDGAPAARFLQQIKRWIEHPYSWVTR